MTSIKPVPLDEIWHMRQLVMYPGESLDFVKLDDDDTGVHAGLYENKTLISVISVFDRNEDAQFRKFATLPSEQGKGYGTMLLQYVFDMALQNRKQSIWCNARLSATGIYYKFGMMPAGDTWSKYGIDFVKMEKRLK
jgi:phosphoribosylformimino-5-aminoimidazole carboxamide ribotide isomerase